MFASFKGHRSPLRHRATLASCRSGGHAIWWEVEADSEAAALALLTTNHEFAKQPRLADSRFTAQRNRTGTASVELIEGVLERRQLVGATHEDAVLTCLERGYWERVPRSTGAGHP